MCFKKKPVEPIPDYTKNTIASIVKGDYPGNVNDLAGPPNDQEDLQNAVLSKWPVYKFRNFKNWDSTAKKLLSELTNLVSRIEPGDLFLTINDNCFSESNTKALNSPKILGRRVYIPENLPRRKIVRSKALSSASKYLAMSACLDHESASDAEFNGRANGAYTYCLIKTMEKGITYLQWHQKALAKLKQLGFDQTCTIEGPIELQNKVIFEDNVSVLYLSSHGSYTYDSSKDESDGQDEGPYLDRLIVDDEINAIIATNPLLI